MLGDVEVKTYPVATPAPVAPRHPIRAVDSGNSAMTNPIRALFLSDVLTQSFMLPVDAYNGVGLPNVFRKSYFCSVFGDK